MYARCNPLTHGQIRAQTAATPNHTSLLRTTGHGVDFYANTLYSNKRIPLQSTTLLALATKSLQTQMGPQPARQVMSNTGRWWRNFGLKWRDRHCRDDGDRSFYRRWLRRPPGTSLVRCCRGGAEAAPEPADNLDEQHIHRLPAGPQTVLVLAETTPEAVAAR